uniref:Protein plastid transcriptionally active 10 n=1 Tax=Tanacetum cinerariifolium TaxID=118510 RepID=A0A699GSG6_TANCI|nr:protein plastid transcriptionally active 10 [Tanacetum cinerariifolium]
MSYHFTTHDKQRKILTTSDFLSRCALLIIILTTLSLRGSSINQFSIDRKILIWTSYVMRPPISRDNPGIKVEEEPLIRHHPYDENRLWKLPEAVQKAIEASPVNFSGRGAVVEDKQSTNFKGKFYMFKI